MGLSTSTYEMVPMVTAMHTTCARRRASKPGSKGVKSTVTPRVAMPRLRNVDTTTCENERGNKVGASMMQVLERVLLSKVTKLRISLRL